jgi:hypothetical protein
MVLSPRARTAIDELVPGGAFQHVKVSIRDHRKKITAADYTFFHPLDLVDCIDLSASVVTWNLVAKDVIQRCEQLVLDESRIDRGLRVFRLGHWPSRIMINADVAAALAAWGLIGLRFVPPREYDGVG